ncbi:TPA: DUF5347 family protein [Yersinia enterocolitica]|nr:DUF5347 family protein [Yersinia enterocolitica]
MQKSARAIELTAEQIKTGLAQTAHVRLMLNKGKNRVTAFLSGVSFRHRGLIYFTAGLHRDKHKLKFHELDKWDRLTVIKAMRELSELTASFPKELPDADAVIKQDP